MHTGMNQIHSPAKAKAYFEDKLAFTIGPVELDRWIKSGENNLIIVDVRDAEDFFKDHIPEAINLPKDQWNNPQELGRSKTNVVYSYTERCHLAASACAIFADKGFSVMELEGGFQFWNASRHENTPNLPTRYKTTLELISSRRQGAQLNGTNSNKR